MTHPKSEETVIERLALYRQQLQPLVHLPRSREAEHALTVLGRVEKEPPTRAALFAVMEAALGVADLNVGALQEETEEWLAVDAPHEFEHYLQFRLRTQFEEIERFDTAWASALEHHGWQLLIDNGFNLVAVSVPRQAVLTTLSLSDQIRPVLLGVKQHAYSEIGLGQAALSAIKASTLAPKEQAEALAKTPLRRLPQIQEYVRQHEYCEEQLAFWTPIVGAYQHYY